MKIYVSSCYFAEFFLLEKSIRGVLTVSLLRLAKLIILIVFKCFPKIVESDFYLRHVLSSVRRHEIRDSQRTEFYEIWYFSIFRKSVEKIQVSWLSHLNTDTLHEDLRTFMIQGGSNMTGTDVARFTHKSVPVIFEPSCNISPISF